MKKYLLIGILLLITGLIGAIYCVETFNNDNSGVTNKYNLALRQVAHKIYMINNDSLSTIAPVSQNTALSYTFKIETFLHYDTLPYLLEQAIQYYELPKKYAVGITNCEDTSTLLGYNSLAFQSRQMPCSSREHNIDCAYINVDFELPKQSKTHIWLLALASLIFGFFFILKAVKSQTQNLEKAIDTSEALEKPDPTSSTSDIGQYTFDSKNLSLSINGEVQTLTFRENKLLTYLNNNKNKVITRDEILQNVWEDEGVIVGRSLDVFISRLRKLLKEDEGLSIKSIHGVGYRFNVNN